MTDLTLKQGKETLDGSLHPPPGALVQSSLPDGDGNRRGDGDRSGGDAIGMRSTPRPA